MTIKGLLAKQKREREEKAEQKKIRLVEIREQENEEIVTALKVIRKSLIGFRPKEINTVWGKGYLIKLNTRTVHILCQFEDHLVRYADDCPRENVRSLSVNIGFIINQPLVSSNVEDFEKDFVQFLNCHNLI